MNSLPKPATTVQYLHWYRSKKSLTCQGTKCCWTSKLGFLHLKKDQGFWTAVQWSSVIVCD